MASNLTRDLVERRDAVDEKFIEFSHPSKIAGNYKSLAQLALIGGRLEHLIRRSREYDRKQRRND